MDESTPVNQIISATSALTPEGRLAPYWVRISGERILEVGHGAPPRSPDLHISQGVLSPGFVDAHAHGGGGATFASEEEAQTVLTAHRRSGTTTMLASLVSASLDTLLAQTEALRPLVESGELAAIHWEGPWLDTAHRGAHDETVLSTPSPAAVTALLDHPASELVNYVTVAPELPGGIEAVERLSTSGISVGIGHTGASCSTTREALAAGAVCGTHLFNAMKGLHHREPGAVLPLLQTPGVFLELICDGVHVHPDMIRFAWESAAQNGGPQRIVLVSDAMAAAAATDGDYTLGGLDVRVRQGVARLVTPDGGEGAIAGSTLTLAEAVRYSIVEAGITAEHALTAATSSPARMVGLDEVGKLLPGAFADLVVLDEQWSVEQVMYRGEWVQDDSSCFH